jgi:WD40 repeat protein
MNTTVFLSYARGDDGEPFEPTNSFVARLHTDLTARGFDVWFDRVSMPSRALTFHQEIRDAIAARRRLVLVVGPKAIVSDYVRQEWQFAWREADKVVTPILRWGDYPLVPDELKLLHCEDFREDRQYPFHLDKLVRQLREPPPPLGKLIAVSSLPAHYLQRGQRLQAIRDALRADLDRPVVISGSAARVGMHGMGGIGKSVLAAALARDRKVREAFPDGIVWVRLGSLPDLRSLMQRVNRDLGGDGAITSEHEGKQRLKEFLANKAVLLVLDDAWRRSDVDAFDVLGARCRALITTRDAGLLTALGGTHHVVELLTDQEARSLLATTAGLTEEDLPAEAMALVAECGGLPLAVALCGALIFRRMPWSSVLERLEKSQIDRIIDRHAVEPQHQSIWHAIYVSVEDLGPAERERFLELGVFPAGETIPELVIAALWKHTAQLDNWDTMELLTMLVERSLIQMTLPIPSSDEGQRRFSLHDLVYDYVHRAIPDPSKLHTKLLAAYARKCADGWPSGPNDGYFFEHLFHHLDEADRLSEMVELLGEYGWLRSKVDNGMVFDLIKDFDVTLGRLLKPKSASLGSPGREVKYSLETIDGLHVFRKSLLLSAPALSKNPAELPGQLLGRMLDRKEENIANVLRKASQDERPGLHPLLASLTKPGGPPLRILDGSDGEAQVLISTKRDCLIAGYEDGTVCVWDANALTEPLILRGHKREIRALTHTSEGYLISASRDHTARVWDLSHPGSPSVVLRGHTESVEALASLPGERVATGSGDGTVRVWELKRLHPEPVVFECGRWVHKLAALPDGRLVSGDTVLRIWDPDHPERPGVVLTKYPYAVSSLAVLPDGRVASSCCSDGLMVRLCNPSNPKTKPLALAAPARQFSKLIVLPDGRIAAASAYDDGTVFIWDPNQPKAEPVVLQGHHYVHDLLPLSNRYLAAASGDYTVRIWDLEHPSNPPFHFAGHTNEVRGLALLSDGRFASCSEDGTVRIWDFAKSIGNKSRGSKVGYQDDVTAIAPLPGGGLVYAAIDGRVRFLPRGRFEKPPVLLAGESAILNNLKVLRDGRIAGWHSYLSRDVTIRIWDPDQPFREPILLVGHSNSVRAMAQLPDGRIVSCSADGSLRLWKLNDIKGGSVVIAKHKEAIADLEVLPDGRVAYVPIYSRSVYLVDPSDPLHRVNILVKHEPIVNSIAALSDGSLAIACGHKVTIVHPDHPGYRLAIPSLQAWRITVLADDRIIITAGRGETDAIMWNPHRPDEGVVCLHGTGGGGEFPGLAYLYIAPLQGGLVFMASATGNVGVWNPQDGERICAFSLDYSVATVTNLDTQEPEIACADRNGGIHILKLMNLSRRS